MEVIPAIDIRGGRCVRLEQGDYGRETVYGEDPVAMAAHWAGLGATRIHVVDLDGARGGRQANAALLAPIVRAAGCPVQTGGGIRDLPTLKDTLASGVSRAVVGTAAVRTPELLRGAIPSFGDRLIVSVDARGGMVKVEGWTESTDLSADSLIDRLESLGVARIIYTDIDRDGVRDGPNFAMYERLTARSKLPVIAAGGVGNLDDLRHLAASGVEGAIIGRALYTGEIDFEEALRATPHGGGA